MAVQAQPNSIPPTGRGPFFVRPRFRENVNAFLFIAPWLIGFLVLTAGPMIGSLGLSFAQWNLLTPPTFLGLGNFTDMVQDELFWISLANTAYYTFIAVPLHLLAALLAALAVNVRLRTVNIYRTMLYLPSITPSVASALLWTWIFNPDFGLANAFLSFLHLPTSQWIYDPQSAKPAFVLMGIWGIGPQMIIFLAGLQNVPDTLHEAAAIDGANWLDRFRYVTLPMLSPVIFFSVIVGIIGSFQVFNSSFIMTQGGPANSTLFYVLYLYRKAWESLSMGYASALAWVLFLIILLFTLIQFRVGRIWVFYEGDLRE
jgi:multiple sugar transport system permease protein